MKRIKDFDSFLILEEAEVKYSESLHKEILDLFNSNARDIDDLGNFDTETGEKTDKSTYPEKFHKTFKLKVSETLYPKFAIQLGAIVLQAGAENLYKFKDDKFNKDIEESIKQKKLNNNLSVLFDKASVKLKYMPFYSGPQDGRLTYGSLSSLKQPFIDDDCIVKFALKLNLYKDTRDEMEETIRHELQHLTQIINSFCLKVGELIIKSSISDITFEKVEKYYKLSFKNPNIGVGKTKTRLKQGDELANFDSQTGKATNFKKVLNLDLSKEEERKKAKTLQYLLDDSEYKPWITDKVDTIFKKWLQLNKNKIDFWKVLYNNQKLFGLRESLTDDQYKKAEQRKKLNEFAKEFNISYNQLIKDIKSFNIDEYAKFLTKYIMQEDREIQIIKKYRKETASDILKLVIDKLKKYFEKSA